MIPSLWLQGMQQLTQVGPVEVYRLLVMGIGEKHERMVETRLIRPLLGFSCGLGERAFFLVQPCAVRREAPRGSHHMRQQVCNEKGKQRDHFCVFLCPGARAGGPSGLPKAERKRTTTHLYPMHETLFGKLSEPTSLPYSNELFGFLPFAMEGIRTTSKQS